jgi:hypothetical protein
MKRGPTRPRQHPFILGAALLHVAPLMRATHKTAAPAMRKRKAVCQDEAASTLSYTLTTAPVSASFVQRFW